MQAMRKYQGLTSALALLATPRALVTIFTMSSLSYAHGASSVPLLGETIGANLRRTVDRCGRNEALVVRSQAYRATYEQLWDAVTRAARSLVALGLSKGDRVGIWAPNRPEWVILQYATARLGVILVNINPAYKAAELEYVLNQAGVRALFLAAGFRQTAYVPLLEEVRGNCPALQRSLVLDEDWDRFNQMGYAVPESAVEQREAE